ncbi:hypothetical protein PA905_40780 [Planktothrix agardhii CCAP 1459/11A]|uniref:Uncharacterized protein n=1 Tax=Planktothrix agardhii CCAP 1459/11A TaxID=282420 RepID=A0A4P5ZHN4_PLAAG|nr:hypothetical protein [Planktothrix agardhii]GDZ95648.1 hypothetical protein PA905_40780 [Planktothrix agardhii CCAP 1459/11A]
MLSKFDEDVILQEFMAEKLLPNQLPNIYKIYPRLAKNLTILGPLKYALEMKRKYSNPN